MITFGHFYNGRKRVNTSQIVKVNEAREQLFSHGNKSSTSAARHLLGQGLCPTVHIYLLETSVICIKFCPTFTFKICLSLCLRVEKQFVAVPTGGSLLDMFFFL